jgi:hypothetical protein
MIFKGDNTNNQINFRFENEGQIVFTSSGPTVSTFNAVIISGSSYDIMNGTYIEDGIVNGKNKYSKDPDNYIFWDDENLLWIIKNDGLPQVLGDIYDSIEDVEFPWEVETWSDGYGFGQPTLTPTNVSVSTFNAVIISGAGSTEVNGTYTERGLDPYQNRVYYNLIGQPDNSEAFAISTDGFDWILYGASDIMYTATVALDFPWQNENWAPYFGGVNPPPTVTPTSV